MRGPTPFTPLRYVDPLGLDRYLGGCIHAWIVVVDPTNKSTGFTQIDFGPDEASDIIHGNGQIALTPVQRPSGFSVTKIKSTREQDAMLLQVAKAMANDPPKYTLTTFNCRHLNAYLKGVSMGDLAPDPLSGVPILSNPYAKPIPKYSEHPFRSEPPGVIPTGY